MSRFYIVFNGNLHNLPDAQYYLHDILIKFSMILEQSSKCGKNPTEELNINLYKCLCVRLLEAELNTNQLHNFTAKTGGTVSMCMCLSFLVNQMRSWIGPFYFLGELFHRHKLHDEYITSLKYLGKKAFYQVFLLVLQINSSQKKIYIFIYKYIFILGLKHKQIYLTLNLHFTLTPNSGTLQPA